MSEVWINDIDLADYGFVLGGNPAQVASPSFTDAAGALLGAVGGTWLGEPTQASPRAIVIRGAIVAATGAAYRSAVETLKAIATLGAVRLRFADHTDQEYRDARLTAFEAAPRAALLTNLAGDVQFTFQVIDPLRYDVNPISYALSTTRVSLAMGTAPTFPLIYADGSGSTLTNLVVTLRNAGGDASQTMTFTNSLGANDYRLIDCRRVQVTKSTAGTLADALSELTSGDFLALRPADGGYEQSAWPTLELSSSTGTAIGLVTYTRAWF